MVEENVQATESTQEENVSRETNQKTVGEATQETRPEWLPEKFKTGEDLAKSYQELQSQFGKKATALREKITTELAHKRLETRPASAGEYLLPETIDETLAPDNELLQWWSNHAFNNGYSQDEFTAGIEKYFDAFSKLVPNEENEKKALGDNADARIEAVGLFANKYFPENLHESIEAITETHHGIKVIEHLMNEAKENVIPTYDANAVGQLDENSLKQMMQDPRYHNPAKQDPAYIEKVTQGFKKLYG